MYQPAKITEDRGSELPAISAGGGPLLARGRFAPLKIGVLTLFGAALAFPLADRFPQRFSVEARLKIEGASESAISDAVTALHSKRSLDNLIRALNLGSGSEFAVDRSSITSVVSDIVSGEAMTVSQAENRLRDRLSQAIATSYDHRTGELAISVTATQATGATRIANMLGDIFLGEVVVSDARVSTPLVEKLRQTLDHAEAALSGFIAGTDQQKLAELRRAESEEQQLAAKIAGVEAELQDLKQKAAQASAMKLDDVLNKPLPDSLEYTGLDYQRQRHVEAKLAVDQLSGDLGPRHPRLLAAQAALEDTRSDIQTALKQLATSLRQQEMAAAKHLAELKGEQAKTPDDKGIAASAARLRALEAAVDEARGNYLDALHRAETETKVPVAKVEVLVPAAAERARAQGLSLLAISGIGTSVGFCLGLMVAFFTRKPIDVPADDAEPEFEAEPASVIEQDWPEEDVPRQESILEEEREPHDGDPARKPQSPFHPRYPAPANDSPLVDHIREVLTANRRVVREAEVPPLIAAVMSGRLADEPSHTMWHSSQEDIRKAEEVSALRRNMAELRERVEVYSARRNASRR